MAKRRIGILAALLCLCICWVSCCALAASTADAKEPISPDTPCALTIRYCCDGAAFADVSVKLYKVAAISADFQYTPTPSFSDTGLILNGIQTTDEWNVIRSTLESYILGSSVASDCTAVTDAHGQASFSALLPGLYLAVAENPNQGCTFDPALISLPGLGEDGLWQYEIAVAAKPRIVPNETVQLQVLKLWQGDEGRADRPQSVRVEIFRNGVSYETVTLSQANNWSYSWQALDDGTSWMVVERDIPAGYTVTVTQRETAFVLTNTRLSDTPGTNDSPQTGDTSRILLATVLMYLSGIMLILLGIAGKRKRL